MWESSSIPKQKKAKKTKLEVHSAQDIPIALFYSSFYHS